MLRNPGFKKRLCALVFDECHLLSTWKSFRACFAWAVKIRAMLAVPKAVMFLTATMTKRVRDEVLDMMQLSIGDFAIAWRPTLRMDCTLRFWLKQAGDLSRLFKYIAAVEDRIHTLIFCRQEKTMSELWWAFLTDHPQISGLSGLEERQASELLGCKGQSPVEQKPPERSAFARSLRRRTKRSRVRQSIGESISRLDGLVSKLRAQQYSSNAPASDAARTEILADLANELGRLRVVFATIGMCVNASGYTPRKAIYNTPLLFAALGVGVDVRASTYGALWECLWKMSDLLQAIGRIGRSVGGPRPCIDVFCCKTDLPGSKADSLKAAPEPEVLDLCFGAVDPNNSKNRLPPICRHLGFAMYFAWEPHYFDGFRSIADYVANARSRLDFLHECCDICAQVCKCSEPSDRGCAVWRQVLREWAR
jgi:hypothetical protein